MCLEKTQFRTEEPSSSYNKRLIFFRFGRFTLHLWSGSAFGVTFLIILLLLLLLPVHL